MTKDIVFTERTLEPEVAKSLGLIHDIMPEEELVLHALSFARQFRKPSRSAIGMARTILNKSTEIDQRALSELESYSQTLCLETDYHLTQSPGFSQRSH